MNDDLRTELSALRSDVTAGFRRADERADRQQEQHLELRSEMLAGFRRVEELFELQQHQHLELRDAMVAGFARVDHFIELQQEQHLTLRAEVRELRAMLLALTERVDQVEFRLAGVEAAVQRLDGEVRAFRDWASSEFADVRGQLRSMRREAADRDDTLRRDVDHLTARVDRLEERFGER